MTWRRATHYTWRAFLTLLLLGIPGLAIQIGITGLIAAWTWTSDSSVSPSTLGWFSSARAVGTLWLQISFMFVIFKYLPDAIAEVQENRNATRATAETQASGALPNLEQ